MPAGKAWRLFSLNHSADTIHHPHTLVLLSWQPYLYWNPTGKAHSKLYQVARTSSNLVMKTLHWPASGYKINKKGSENFKQIEQNNPCVCLFRTYNCQLEFFYQSSGCTRSSSRATSWGKLHSQYVNRSPQQTE